MAEDKNTPQTIPEDRSLPDQFRREMDSMMSRYFGSAWPFFPMETAAQRTGFTSLDMTGAISPAIEINVEELNVGDVVHIDDVELPEGAEVPHEVNFTVLTVVGRKAEEEVEEGAEEEGAEAVEGAAESSEEE